MVGESESSSLGINESYIQSDIANIIHKMYSPHFHMEENLLSLSEGRLNIVEENTSSNRQIHWQENEIITNKRCGHYFETETRNHLRTAMLDSSSSGSVSLPSIRHKPIRSGTYACRCCRRKISNRLHSKRVSSTCGNCRICAKVLPPQASIREDSVLNLSEDFSRQPLVSNPSRQIRPDKPAKKAHAVLDEKRVDKQENVHGTKIALYNSCNGEKLSTKEPDVSGNKHQSKTLLSRVFSRLIGIASLDKSKSQTDNHIEAAIKSEAQVHEIKVNHHQLELGVQPTNLSIQKQQSSKRLTSAKQNKRRGCRNLVENPDEINSILSDDCKLNLHLELASSGDDKSKLPSVSFEEANNKCREMFQDSSDDAKEPPVVSMVCMSKSGELNLGNEPVRSEQVPKAHLLSPDVKIPKCVAQPRGCADTYRLEFGDTTATDLMADRREEWAVRFWAKVFGHGHLVLEFATAFALQLLRFVLQGLVRPLVWGSLQLACDHCLKPCLALLFDGLLQPVLRLLQNVACAARDVARPLAEAAGLFVGELARLLSACRLVEVHAPPSPPQDRTVP